MFASAGLKLDRAHKHIRDLNAEFFEFVGTSPHRPVVHGHRQGDSFEVSVSVEMRNAPPAHLAAIIGDAVHNLRCALDHAVWELIAIDGGQQDRHTKLPTGNNRVNYEAACNGMITPRADTKRFFMGREIFPDGRGDALYRLHSYDNADKHAAVIPTVAASSISGLVTINLETGKRMNLGTVLTEPGHISGERVFTLQPGIGLDADRHIHVTPEIFFGEASAFPHQPVLTTLHSAARAVEATIDDLMRLVSNR